MDQGRRSRRPRARGARGVPATARRKSTSARRADGRRDLGIHRRLPCARAGCAAGPPRRGDCDHGLAQRPGPAASVGRTDASRLVRALRQQSRKRRRGRARRAIPGRTGVPSRHHLQPGRRAGCARCRPCECSRAADARSCARSRLRNDLELQRDDACGRADLQARGRRRAAPRCPRRGGAAAAGDGARRAPGRARIRARRVSRQQRAARTCLGSSAEAPRADRRPRRGRLRLDTRFPARAEDHHQRPHARRRPALERRATHEPTTATCCGNWSGRVARAASLRSARGRMASVASKSSSSPA